MKINLSIELIEKLIESGELKPCDIECLDIESRDQLKALFFKMSLPKACKRCPNVGSCNYLSKPILVEQIPFALQ